MWTHSLTRAGAAILVLLFLGCGGPQVEKTSDLETEQSASEPMDDPFSAFGGMVVDFDQDVTLYREPIGIQPVRIVITLMRTEWTERERADGTMEREGTAFFYIQKVDADAELRIKQGEQDSVFGIQIEVQEAGEAYEQESMRYVPFAKTRFTRVP